MSHRIFLSHNHQDKPLVEPVALRLAGIFGKDQVFYDSWSIQPGEGIIEKMNAGLAAPEFVFFFVSTNSLNSGMVRLEWQNALFTASKGKTRIVPVRVDGCEMPPVLRQTLYIDMHTNGLEAAAAQIVSVTQGQASFTPQHEGFSNLTYTATRAVDGSIDIVVRASHLMEPNPSFAFLVSNAQSEVSWEMADSSPFMGGFSVDGFTLHDGRKFNAIGMRPMAGALTPGIPFRARIKKLGQADVNLLGVFHQKAENTWVSVPIASP